MNSSHERQIHRIKQPRHRLVGLDHEHLNQRVREAGILFFRPHHFSLLIQQQLHLRQFQNDLPLLQSPPLNALGQHVHLIEQFHYIPRITHQPARPLRVRDVLRFIDDRLRLAISQPL